MRRLLSFFVLLFLCNSLYGQNVIWSQCYGGVNYDDGYNIISTSDGGTIAVGITQADSINAPGIHYYYNGIAGMWIPSKDVWVIKIDANGVEQWKKCYGGEGNEFAFSIVETIDGYVISGMGGVISGDITNIVGGGDFWVFKIDYSGNIIWSRCYGGYEFDIAYGLAKTSDNGFIVSGYTESDDGGDVSGHHGSSPQRDLWVIKIDSVGNLEWQKCLGGTEDEIYGKCAVDSDDNVYICGWTYADDGSVTCNGPVSEQAWLVKLDNSGVLIWNKCFGGSSVEEFHNITCKNDTLLIIGNSRSSDNDLPGNFGDWDAWIMMCDTAGNIIFSRNYGGSSLEYGKCVIFETDSTLLAGVYTYSNDVQVNSLHAFTESWLVRLDFSGNIIWSKSFGGSSADGVESLARMSNGTIAFCGWTDTNNDGDISGFHLDSLGIGYSDMWLMYLNIPTGLTEKVYPEELSIFPNPFSDQLTIKFSEKTFIHNIQISEITGRIIRNSSDNNSILEKIIIDGSAMQPGIYLLEINTGKEKVVSKLVRM